MSLLRRNPRRDSAEPAIVDALRVTGWSVLRLSVTNGPDLAAAKRGWTVMIEVKTGHKPLRAGQLVWADSWHGPVFVLRTVEDVIALNQRVGRA